MFTKYCEITTCSERSKPKFLCSLNIREMKNCSERLNDQNQNFQPTDFWTGFRSIV